MKETEHTLRRKLGHTKSQFVSLWVQTEPGVSFNTTQDTHTARAQQQQQLSHLAIITQDMLKPNQERMFMSQPVLYCCNKTPEAGCLKRKDVC
jgi:hypothetical protein